MRLPDVNVLVHARNADAVRHAEARRWVEDALSGSEPVGFAWTVLLGFLRITSRPGLLPVPLDVGDALDQVDRWLEAAPAVVLEPTARHAAVLGGLVRAVGVGGNLVSDAHLAALAIEHGALLVTFDGDFARFPGLRWEEPALAARTRPPS